MSADRMRRIFARDERSRDDYVFERWGLILYGVLAGFAVLLAAVLPGRLLGGKRRDILQYLLLAGLAGPAALIIPLATPAPGAAGPAILATVLWILFPVLLFRFRRPRQRLGGACALAALVLALDGVTGGALFRDALWGRMPIAGGRLYGIDNTCMGVLIGAGWVALGIAADTGLRRAQTAQTSAAALSENFPEPEPNPATTSGESHTVRAPAADSPAAQISTPESPVHNSPEQDSPTGGSPTDSENPAADKIAAGSGVDTDGVGTVRAAAAEEPGPGAGQRPGSQARISTADSLRRTTCLSAIGGCVLIAMVIGLAPLGANVGGGVTAAIGAGFFGALLTRRRGGWVGLLSGLALAAAILGLSLGLDASRGAGQGSHLIHNWRQVVAVPAVAVDILIRKLWQNLSLTFWLLPGSIPVWLISREVVRSRKLIDARFAAMPGLRAALRSLLPTMVAGYLINDTGVISVVFIALYYFGALAFYRLLMIP